MLTKEGEEIWNQPCQISNPIAVVCKDAAIVANQGGTNIYVFQKDGLKGEIQTTRPIEKATVSAQVLFIFQFPTIIGFLITYFS